MSSPNQTIKKDYSYPKGLRFDVTTDGINYSDVGVLADGIAWTLNYDLSEIENGNAADPDAQAKNMSVSIAPSALRSWDSAILAKLSAGLMTSEDIAGTIVSGATDTLVSGAWSEDQVYALDGQNATGLQQTINSVTGGTDGALALDTDYFVVKAEGGWGIMIIAGAVTTTDQDIVIDYDYTPAAGTYLYSGTSSKILDYYGVRLRHYTDADFNFYDYEAIFYRVRPDAGAIVMTKSGALSGNGLDEWNISMTAEIEDGNADGRQLFRIYDGEDLTA